MYKVNLFFDKMKLCRVINTSLITPGEVRLSADNEQPISIVDSLRKPELQEGYLVDPDLKYQTYINPHLRPPTC